MATKRKIKPLFVTIDTASQLTGMSKPTLYSWCEEGAPHSRYAAREGKRGTIRFTINQLVELMAEKNLGTAFDKEQFAMRVREELWADAARAELED